MTTSRRSIDVGGIAIEVVRKEIKNLHVGVYPPSGRVRVAAPLRLKEDAIRLAVVSRLAWIRRQQKGFVQQDRQSGREMVNGESHYVEGLRYRLRVVEAQGRPIVRLAGSAILELLVRPGTGPEKRAAQLEQWRRRELRRRIPVLLGKWEERVGVHPSAWGIRRMKTRWGTCNTETGRIWINLELHKKKVSCLEYILVHELIHLIERRHSEVFLKLMDQAMPNWRIHRAELNRAPLAHEEWEY